LRRVLLFAHQILSSVLLSPPAGRTARGDEQHLRWTDARLVSATLALTLKASGAAPPKSLSKSSIAGSDAIVAIATTLGAIDAHLAPLETGTDREGTHAALVALHKTIYPTGVGCPSVQLWLRAADSLLPSRGETPKHPPPLPARRSEMVRPAPPALPPAPDAPRYEAKARRGRRRGRNGSSILVRPGVPPRRAASSRAVTLAPSCRRGADSGAPSPNDARASLEAPRRRGSSGAGGTLALADGALLQQRAYAPARGRASRSRSQPEGEGKSEAAVNAALARLGPASRWRGAANAVRERVSAQPPPPPPPGAVRRRSEAQRSAANATNTDAAAPMRASERLRALGVDAGALLLEAELQDGERAFAVDSDSADSDAWTSDDDVADGPLAAAGAQAHSEARTSCAAAGDAAPPVERRRSSGRASTGRQSRVLSEQEATDILTVVEAAMHADASPRARRRGTSRASQRWHRRCARARTSDCTHTPHCPRAADTAQPPLRSTPLNSSAGHHHRRITTRCRRHARPTSIPAAALSAQRHRQSRGAQVAPC
jgi:hypothetical protein